MSCRKFAQCLVLLLLAACVTCNPVEVQKANEAPEEVEQELVDNQIQQQQHTQLTEKEWTEVFEFYNDTLSALRGLKDVWTKPFDELFDHLRQNNTNVKLLKQEQVAELERDFGEKARDALERIDDELREFQEIYEKSREMMRANETSHYDRYVFGMAWVLSEELAAYQLMVGNVLREAENVAELMIEQQSSTDRPTTISPYAVSVEYNEAVAMTTITTTMDEDEDDDMNDMNE
ncbi:hypothetical protein TKK_0010493 [Trichogramma kaykai]|uniref:Uncharacterized protein n=1 Tax=Trichogramma kaykai TaxID=54128 RepID=A0ABD2WWW6_9HYME